MAGCGVQGAHTNGAPNHHVDGGYRNPPGSPVREGGFLDLVGAFTDRIWESITNYDPPISSSHIMHRQAVLDGRAQVKGTTALTWLGHATFLMTLADQTVLTDPFLTDYATFQPPFGPKRTTAPGLFIEDLPPIDIIVVSHNHYDHLDLATISALPNKENIQVVVPLGLAALFADHGYQKITELDWYGQTQIGGLTIQAVPSVHSSGRGLFDKNATLWAGYVFDDAKRKVYFSGDTAYGPVYPEIGRKIGPVDYALVPIGAYKPRRRMKAVHVNPDEAIQIGQDLGARVIVAMHWGTIRLSEEPFDEAPDRFRARANALGLSDEATWVLKIGESRPLK